MYPRASRDPGTLPVARRLLVFVAASAALHALTLGAYSPGTGDALSTRGLAPRVLQAALALDTSAQSASVDGGGVSERDAAAGTQPPSPALGETSNDIRSSSGERAGVPLPLPDRWYSASEVEVRAEPLVAVRPDYPPELAGPDAVAAKVRLRVFIDEYGVVRKLQVASPGPQRAFDAAATQAWEAVRFSPAMKAGIAVKSQKLLELDFLP